MKILTLWIDNIGSLENGGPISHEMRMGMACVGRKPSMDWSLPDPTRHISGHHLDIVSEDGESFWVHDRSSNGTFLQGDRFRLPGPYEIRDGDKFIIGRYIVRAELQIAAQAPAGGPMAEVPPLNMPAMNVPPVVDAPFAAHDPMAAHVDPGPYVAVQEAPIATAVAEDPFDDVWGDFSQPAPAPEPATNTASSVQQPAIFSNSREGGTASPSDMQTPDFSKFEGAPAPSGVTSPPLQVPSPPQVALDDPFGDLGPQQDLPQLTPPVAPAQQIAPKNQAFGGMPAPAPIPPIEKNDFAVQPPEAVPQPQHQPIPNMPQIEADVPRAEYWSDVGGTPDAYVPESAQPEKAEFGQQFIEAFLEGAGVQNVADLQMDPLELARLAGQCARSGTNEMMAMLHERAAVKLFMSGEDRTMRVAAGNNPMKFLPDPDQAFQAMFLRPRDGYMTGAAAFQNSLSDIRTHQTAFIAALQPALSDMIDGLSPDDIEAYVGSGSALMSGGGRRKFWDEFAKRWEARASEGENGMLDVFIKAFARHYSNAVRQSLQNPN
jgi:type VI secretion system protein ImpI